MANLLADKPSLNANTAPASWATMTDMTSGSVTIDGTGSVVLLMFHAVLLEDDSTDLSAIFRFTVDASSTNSPICCAARDNNVGEISNCTMVWAVSGLSAGTHTFTVEWQIQAAAPAASTSRSRRFQVLEFLSTEATLALDTGSAVSDTSDGTWNDMLGMSGSVNPTTGAIQILLASMLPDLTPSGDDKADVQFAIDGTRDGPLLTLFSDSTSVYGSIGMMWIATGIATGSKTYSLQWTTRSGALTTNTTHRRIFQVIEIAENFTFDTGQNKESVSEDTADTVADITDMTVTYTPDSADSILLMMFNMVQATAGGDEVAMYQLADDGTPIGPELVGFSDDTDDVHSVSIHFAVTGETASSVWSAQWTNEQNAPTTDTARARSFQVADFKKVAVTRRPQRPKFLNGIFGWAWLVASPFAWAIYRRMKYMK